MSQTPTCSFNLISPIYLFSLLDITSPLRTCSSHPFRIISLQIPRPSMLSFNRLTPPSPPTFLTPCNPYKPSLPTPSLDTLQPPRHELATLVRLAQPKAGPTSKAAPGKTLHKFYVDYSVPAADNVFDPAAFEKFLHDRIKVDGKPGQLGDHIQISKDGQSSFSSYFIWFEELDGWGSWPRGRRGAAQRSVSQQKQSFLQPNSFTLPTSPSPTYLLLWK